MHLINHVLLFIVLYLICIPITTLAIYILIGVINSALLFIVNARNDKKKALSFVVYLIDWPLMTLDQLNHKKVFWGILSFIWICGFIVAAVAAISTTWTIYSIIGSTEAAISLAALWEALIIYFIISLFGFLIASS